MNCPRCGYARSDFDAYCLRCRLMDAQGVRPPVNFADRTVVMSEPPAALPSPPARRRRSPLWALALLALLVGLGGAVLWHRAVAPHPSRSEVLSVPGRPGRTAI